MKISAATKRSTFSTGTGTSIFASTTMCRCAVCCVQVCRCAGCRKQRCCAACAVSCVLPVLCLVCCLCVKSSFTWCPLRTCAHMLADLVHTWVTQLGRMQANGRSLFVDITTSDKGVDSHFAATQHWKESHVKETAQVLSMPGLGGASCMLGGASCTLGGAGMGQEWCRNGARMVHGWCMGEHGMGC